MLRVVTDLPHERRPASRELRSQGAARVSRRLADISSRGSASHSARAGAPTRTRHLLPSMSGRFVHVPGGKVLAASSGSVHILMNSSRAHLECTVHMARPPAVPRARSWCGSPIKLDDDEPAALASPRRWVVPTERCHLRAILHAAHRASPHRARARSRLPRTRGFRRKRLVCAAAARRSTARSSLLSVCSRG